jgi:histidyl-tRNA synthetase
VSERIQAPRGTFDVLPDDADAREVVEREARQVLEAAGYRRIETPTFEATELFARGVGEATDIVRKEMFTFEDQGGRSMTLRPEGTAPVCRAYVEHGMHKLPQPVKLWYLSSFYRHEAPQAGRYRQFWQVGAEAIGSDDPAVDAEIIVLLADLLDALNTHGVHLRISSLGTPEARADYREELQSYLRANRDRLAREARERIELNPLRAFDSDDPGTREVMQGAPRLLDRLASDDLEHFAAVRALLDAADVPYEVDPTLVRGLDYYTRTVFEFESSELGAQSGVGRRRALRPARRADRRAGHPRLRVRRRSRAHPPRGRPAAGRPASGGHLRVLRRRGPTWPRLPDQERGPARRSARRRWSSTADR